MAKANARRMNGFMQWLASQSVKFPAFILEAFVGSQLCNTARPEGIISEPHFLGSFVGEHLHLAESLQSSHTDVHSHCSIAIGNLSYHSAWPDSSDFGVEELHGPACAGRTT